MFGHNVSSPSEACTLIQAQVLFEDSEEFSFIHFRITGFPRAKRIKICRTVRFPSYFGLPC